MDQRLTELTEWVLQQLDLESGDLEPVSGDASFRRYFRLSVQGESYIAMDAPPEKEDSTGFVAIAASWFKQGIAVPELKRIDLDKGFLLLSDFGDQLLLSLLKPESPDEEKGNLFYGKAMNQLTCIQNLSLPDDYTVPPYDAALLQREMALFPDWLLTKKLALTLSQSEETMLAETFSLLEQSALQQSQVLVHRDYHARNLMVLDNDDLGIIDFQDAVIGPVTYDLVSLLRDCYIVWPDHLVDKWCREFHQQANVNKKLNNEYEQFKRDFDWMGLQRHLKASGIFARLSLRDGKHAYLNDIPRTVEYLARVSANYDELTAFNRFLVLRVMPALGSLEGVSLKGASQ